MAKISEQDKEKVFSVDGVEYKVIRPTIEILTEANKLRRETFNQELEAGSLLRDQLEEELRKRELWNEDREANYHRLRAEIVDHEYALAKGGIRLQDAKSIALMMKNKRAEMVSLLSARTDLDANTCEGKADAIRFNYLFANCLVYSDSGEKYFPNGLGDYLLRQEDPVALVGATEFFYLISNTDQVDDKLPENKFLKQFNFVNEKYQLVDKSGKLIDHDGRHIDEEGNYIKWINDKDFIFVDVNGRELDDNGDFKVEFSPFLDDDGKPVGVVETEEAKPAKRTRKRKATPKKEPVEE